MRQIDLVLPAVAERFVSGLLDRQAKSMCSRAGFLKVLAACLERNRFEGPLRWSGNCSRVEVNLLAFDTPTAVAPESDA